MLVACKEKTQRVVFMALSSNCTLLEEENPVPVHAEQFSNERFVSKLLYLSDICLGQARKILNATVAYIPQFVLQVIV
jgi:hypothetical protein